MNLRDELATILDDHQLSVEPVASEPGLRALCSGCGWQLDVYTTDSARWEHASHIADLQIAYLRDNLGQHAEELGMNRRTRNVDYGNDPLPPTRVKQVRFVTDWSRADD